MNRFPPPMRRRTLFVLSVVACGIATPLGLGAFRIPGPEDAAVSKDPTQLRTRVILVRHADRNGKADELTDAGRARAQELVHVLEKSPLHAVFHSEFTRTEATATPVATARGLSPQRRGAAELDALVGEIRAKHAGETVLVVAHSDTVPKLVKAFGGPEFTIGDNEFDDLFVLEFESASQAPPSCLRLQYGAKSP